MMNLTTALAWSCYFFGLSHLEPSIVNTLHSGMGPLTVVVAGRVRRRVSPRPIMSDGGSTSAMPGSRCRSWRSAGSCCRAVPAWRRAARPRRCSASRRLLVSGASITVSLLYCKRLHDHGVNAEVVTSVRYVLLILVAGRVVWHKGGLGGIGSAGEAATLTALATVLIVLPLYAFQVGIALTAPLTANVLRALGPVFVFALQQIDGRLTYSTPTLIGILAYSAAAILSNVAHARERSGRPRRRAARQRPAPAAAAAAGGALKLDDIAPAAMPPGWP